MDGYRDKIHQRWKVFKNLGDEKSKSLCKKSEKIHKNREKKIEILWCKAIKNPMNGFWDKIHQKWKVFF